MQVTPCTRGWKPNQTYDSLNCETSVLKWFEFALHQKPIIPLVMMGVGILVAVSTIFTCLIRGVCGDPKKVRRQKRREQRRLLALHRAKKAAAAAAAEEEEQKGNQQEVEQGGEQQQQQKQQTTPIVISTTEEEQRNQPTKKKDSKLEDHQMKQQEQKQASTIKQRINDDDEEDDDEDEKEKRLLIPEQQRTLNSSLLHKHASLLSEQSETSNNKKNGIINNQNDDDDDDSMNYGATNHQNNNIQHEQDEDGHPTAIATATDTDHLFENIQKLKNETLILNRTGSKRSLDDLISEVSSWRKSKSYRTKNGSYTQMFTICGTKLLVLLGVGMAVGASFSSLQGSLTVSDLPDDVRASAGKFTTWIVDGFEVLLDGLNPNQTEFTKAIHLIHQAQNYSTHEIQKNVDHYVGKYGKYATYMIALSVPSILLAACAFFSIIAMLFSCRQQTFLGILIFFTAFASLSNGVLGGASGAARTLALTFCNEIDAQIVSPRSPGIFQNYFVPSVCETNLHSNEVRRRVHDGVEELSNYACTTLSEACSPGPYYNVFQPTVVWRCDIAPNCSKAGGFNITSAQELVDNITVKEGVPFEKCQGCTVKECAVNCSIEDLREIARVASQDVHDATRAIKALQFVINRYLDCNDIADHLADAVDVCAELEGGLQQVFSGAALGLLGSFMLFFGVLFGKKRFVSCNGVMKENHIKLPKLSWKKRLKRLSNLQGNDNDGENKGSDDDDDDFDDGFDEDDDDEFGYGSSRYESQNLWSTTDGSSLNTINASSSYMPPPSRYSSTDFNQTTSYPQHMIVASSAAAAADADDGKEKKKSDREEIVQVQKVDESTKKEEETDTKSAEKEETPTVVVAANEKEEETPQAIRVAANTDDQDEENHEV